MQPPLETKRLILRDYEASDWATYCAQFKEPASRHQILRAQCTDQYLATSFRSALWWAQQRSRLSYHLMIVLKAEQQLIGNCCLTDLFIGSEKTKIGWHLSQAFRGQGFITETAQCLLALGFDEHRVAAIGADCFADNFASMRVMEKIGMRRTASNSLQQWLRGWQYNEIRPIVRYQIRRQTWEQRSNPDIH